MGEKYRICLIIPAGYQHSLAFVEPVFLLRAAFEDLGIDYTVGVNELEEDRINVLLGYHLLGADSGLSKFRYIPYQFEQLGEGGTLLDNENARRTLREAEAVWDYSERNVSLLRMEGISAKYLPLGYHPALEFIEEVPEKDIDVLFIGSMNERRKTILQELQANHGLRVAALFGVYGKERDDAIARAKINIHIHYYDTKIYQQLRVAHFINNRRFAVVEEAHDNPYPMMDICQVSYEQLTDTCRYYLAHPKERREKAEENHRQFKENYPMTDQVRRVLGGSGIRDQGSEGGAALC